ncbi:MAG: GC-type dockerin domain-anchored protein [Planctomycetota bacterium]
MNRIAAAASVLGPLALAGAAAAQPIVLTVDPAQSTIDADVEVQSAFGTSTDSDSSAVAGTVTIELDSFGQLGGPDAPAAVTISGFELIAQDDLTFSFGFSIFGNVNIDAVGLGLAFPAGEPPVAGTVDPATGAFTVAGVPSLTEGTITATGSGLVGGALGTTVIDLPTLGTTIVDVTGTLVIDDDTITASVSTPLMATNEPVDGVVVTVDGSADAVATGPVPDAADCPCDVNLDTLCDGSDFFAWVSAFGNNDPAGDVNDDGSVDGSDFFAWVSAFGQGC